MRFADSNVVRRENIPEEVPEKPGVYRWYYEMKNGNLRLWYIGRTKNLRQRLRNHPKSADIAIYDVIEDADERRQIEKKMIAAGTPPANRQYLERHEWIETYASVDIGSRIEFHSTEYDVIDAEIGSDRVPLVLE